MSTPTLDLNTLHLEHGSHSYPSEGLCLLEAVALFAGEKHTDHPKCVSPLLANVGIRLNDRATDTQRQDLKRFIPLVVGTAGDGQDDARRWLAVDRSVRFLLPKYLDLLDRHEQAGTLRALPRITDADTYRPHAKRLRTVADEMYELRRNRYETIRAAVREALKNKPDAVDAAAAVAGAVAVDAAAAAAAAAAGAADVAAAVDAAAAVAAAAAGAADVAAAAAADVAAAVAAAAAVADDPWTTTYEAVYVKVKPIYQEKCAGLIAESWDDAVVLYAGLIDPAKAVV